MVSIFRGEYSFLSNFYLSDMKSKEHVYKSAEHLYQTAKCLNKEDRDKIRNAPTAKAAKILGKYVKIKDHWDVDKVYIMEEIVRVKFRNKKLRKLLKETGDKELTEQNYWHDTFWGVCGCTKHQKTGFNMLGKILMKIRAENNNKQK